MWWTASWTWRSGFSTWAVCCRRPRSPSSSSCCARSFSGWAASRPPPSSGRSPSWLATAPKVRLSVPRAARRRFYRRFPFLGVRHTLPAKLPLMPRYEMLDTLLNVIGRVQQLQRAAEVGAGGVWCPSRAEKHADKSRSHGRAMIATDGLCRRVRGRCRSVLGAGSPPPSGRPLVERPADPHHLPGRPCRKSCARLAHLAYLPLTPKGVVALLCCDQQYVPWTAETAALYMTRVWVACHDSEERTSTLAKQLWQDTGASLGDDYAAQLEPLLGTLLSRC